MLINEHNKTKTLEGIKNLMNNISQKINQLSSNGKIIDNPKSISNKLNNFFVNVGPTNK